MQDDPSIVPAYCGQDQTQHIVVAGPVAGWEEGPWVMPPYQTLFPQEAGEAWVPPPVKQIDIFTAQQTWPL
jgi:hypothetical protein